MVANDNELFSQVIYIEQGSQDVDTEDEEEVVTPCDETEFILDVKVRDGSTVEGSQAWKVVVGTADGIKEV